MARRPVIIDTDTGSSFAHAAMLVLGCGLFSIEGITTVSGCTSARKAAAYCSRIREMCSGSWDIAAGAERPMIPREMKANASDDCAVLEEIFSGKSPAPAREKAWDLIYRKAVELGGEAELFCTGPLTNIGIALIRHRDLPKYIKRVTIAAGSVRSGDATVYAEYNVYSDPHAFKSVLDAGFAEVNLVDLEFGRKVCLEAGSTVRFNDLPDSNPWKPFLEAAERDRIRKLGDPGFVRREGSGGEMRMHDAAAAFAMAIPAAVNYMNVYSMVEMRSEISMGRTLFDFRKRFTDDPNLSLAVSASADMFTDFYFRCLHTFDGGRAI